jgi:UDP-N-acetylglucosamine acyltransferase
MGRNNTVYSGAILGEAPQHLKYNGEPTTLDIGDDNVFREHVTIHRGTTQSMKTTIGNHNYFMVNSHVAHDCVIGSNCFLTNGCMMGGHCVMDDQAILSGNSVVHQYTRVGRLSLLSGISGTSKDIPPFMIQQGYNSIHAVNVVGMRRAGMTYEQIDAVRTAFKILFRERMLLPAAVAKLEHDLGSIDVIQELVTFLRGTTRGINTIRNRMGQEAA